MSCSSDSVIWVFISVSFLPTNTTTRVAMHQGNLSTVVYLSLKKTLVLGCHRSDQQIINGAIRKKNPPSMPYDDAKPCHGKGLSDKKTHLLKDVLELQGKPTVLMASPSRRRVSNGRNYGHMKDFKSFKETNPPPPPPSPQKSHPFEFAGSSNCRQEVKNLVKYNICSRRNFVSKTSMNENDPSCCSNRSVPRAVSKPCLIAKLMGLEELPSLEKVQSVKKSMVVKNFSEKDAPQIVVMMKHTPFQSVSKTKKVSDRIKSQTPSQSSSQSSCSSSVHIQMADMERKNTRPRFLNKTVHSRPPMKPDRTQLRSRNNKKVSSSKKTRGGIAAATIKDTNRTAENKEGNNSSERKLSLFYEQKRRESGTSVKDRKRSTHSSQSHEEIKFSDTNNPNKTTHGYEEEEEEDTLLLSNQVLLTNCSTNKLADCRRKNTQNTKTESKTHQLTHHTNNPTIYTEINNNDLYLRLEKDLRCSAMTGNGIWDQGWINRFSIEDSVHVVCDLEKLMTVMLVEEVFMELVL